MALIAAVIGSFFGAIFGAISMFVFNASLLTAFGLYAAMSLGAMVLTATALMMRSQDRHHAHAVFEGQLDADWQDVETRTRPMKADEAEFHADLEDPLSDVERKTGVSNRKTTDRSAG